MIILILLAVLSQFWSMREYIEWSKIFHENIPDGFFQGERWDFASEMREQAETTQQINTLDKRMSLMESQHLHTMDSLQRIEDAVIDK